MGNFYFVRASGFEPETFVYSMGGPNRDRTYDLSDVNGTLYH